jgi:hypothetical protein
MMRGGSYTRGWRLQRISPAERRQKDGEVVRI